MGIKIKSFVISERDVNTSLFDEVIKYLNSNLTENQHTFQLDGVVFSPKILSEEFAHLQEGKRHLRKVNAYIVSLRINYEEWIVNSYIKQVQLTKDFITRALDEIPKKNMPQCDKDIILQVLDGIE